MRKCAVGGQAVMEGVMMKSDKGIAMAVRRADGKIVASYKNQVSKAQKGTFFLPIMVSPQNNDREYGTSHYKKRELLKERTEMQKRVMMVREKYV